MSSRSTDIIFLLGAGASVEAGIPASATMVDEIERLLAKDNDWQQFHRLYNHVKSAIHYSAGLKGKFGRDVPFNIETLVIALYELERNEEHPLYPFIASWNTRFVALANNDFSNVKAFRRLILRELKKWMCPEDTSKSQYYKGFESIQRVVNYPLHIFSLNYDLCMERLNNTNFQIETGFAGYGPDCLWDWERFEQNESMANPSAALFLYKLHGSMNWKRDDAKNLYSVEQIERVEYDRMEVIFGRDFKLEAADPYLFYAYQFRRFTLAARLVVVIGYGFADSHINKMLSQALRSEGTRKILVVARCDTDEECKKREQEIAESLEAKPDQVTLVKGTAKSFLESDNLGDYLVGLIPKAENEPF
jgi:hypothetical protein